MSGGEDNEALGGEDRMREVDMVGIKLVELVMVEVVVEVVEVEMVEW